MPGPEDNPDDECKDCRDYGFVKVKRGKKWEVVPCPSCNPDGVPYGEADCDNF